MRFDANSIAIYNSRDWGMRPDEKAKQIGELRVDEGAFYDTLDYNPHNNESIVLGTNYLWDELVDAEGFLALLVKHLAPGFVAEPSPYIGVIGGSGQVLFIK